MNKINNKGQGALEYLLLIGGAVLIAVIVIALLVGLGSQNADDARQKNKEATEASNMPIPSMINSATCNNGNFIISWTPVHKEGNTYHLIINGTMVDVVFNQATNPIVTNKPACKSDDTVAIKTVNNEVSVLSPIVTVK